MIAACRKPPSEACSRRSWTCSAISVGMYSSQPSSPTYVTRVARTIAYPSSISRDVPNGNAAFEKASGLTRRSSSRDRGPWTFSTANAEVTSVTVARASAGICASSQARSRRGGRSADDEEAPVVEAGHGNVGLDAAASSATACARAGRARRKCRWRRSGSGPPRRRGPGRAASRSRSGRTGGRPRGPRGARGPSSRTSSGARSCTRRAARRIDGVPVRALPPGRLAEDRARRRELPVERRAAHAPRGSKSQERPGYCRVRVRSWR